MEFKKSKAAAYLWLTGSILFFAAVVLFVFVYRPPAGTDAEKTAQIVNNWPLVSNIWRMETLAAVLLTVSSWYFATVKRSMSWFLVAFGHIAMIVMYAFMLGSYPVAAGSYGESPNLFPMTNEAAVWVFGFSNLLFLTGLAGVYFKSEILGVWVKRTGVVISSLGAVGSLALFFELITFGNLNIGGPLILILYLLNAYLGFRLAKEASDERV